MLNQIPNLNHYAVNHGDERFGFLPFVGGLAVGALAGGFGGPRPCGPMCGPMMAPMPMQPQFVPVMQPMPVSQPIMMGQPSFQLMPTTLQGPLIETSQTIIR